MADKKTKGTDTRRRETGQQTRSRKVRRRQRARKKQFTRLVVYVLLAALAVLLILALVAIGKRWKSSREERAIEEALQEEISNSSVYSAAEVLHLSFPVLTLDGSAGAEETDAEEEEELSGDEEAAETGETEEEEAPAEAVYPKPNLTVSEFRQILQDLYDRGYVLVNIYSLSEATTDGYQAGRVMVPDGKKPLVISQKDVSYAAEDTEHATALVKNGSGKVVCSYFTEDGVQATGAVDVVPLVEEFIAEHPDFSYKGARGILGVTGYRGLLGYQTARDDRILGTIRIEKEGGGSHSAGGDLVGEGTGAEAVASVPAVTETPEPGAASAGTTENDALISKNKETVKDLLSTLRSGGWQMASNGYALVSYGSQFAIMKADADEWERTVEPLVGTTDILLLPEGADIGGWAAYSEDNQRYRYLHELGFRQFCVEDDGAFAWAQIRPGYVRQGMHTIEHYGEYTSLMTTE